MFDSISLIGSLPLLAEIALVAALLAGAGTLANRLSGGNLASGVSEGLFVLPIALFAGAALLLSALVMIGVPMLLGVIALHLTGGHFLVWAALIITTLFAAWIALIDTLSF